MTLKITNITGSPGIKIKKKEVGHFQDCISVSVSEIAYGPCEGIFQVHKLENIRYSSQCSYLQKLGYLPEQISQNSPVSIFANTDGSKKILLIKGVGAVHFQGRFFLDDIRIQRNGKGDFVGFTVRKGAAFYSYICKDTLYTDPSKCLFKNYDSADGSFPSLVSIDQALAFIGEESPYSKQ